MRLSVLEDLSNEHFEEVSCELQNTSNFEEHIDVTTTYLGRYLAQGGPKNFQLRECNILRWQRYYNRALV